MITTPGADGSHLSTARRFQSALTDARRLDVAAAQVWVQDNEAFDRDLGPEDIRLGRALAAALPTVEHASYSAAITYSENDPRSAAALGGIRGALYRVARLGFTGLVVHPGEIRDELDVAAAVASLRTLAPHLQPGCPLLLENTADGLHSRLAVLRHVIETAQVEHVGICWDTAHSYAAGLDLADAVVAREELNEAGGLVQLVHLGNSRAALGSGGDDHEGLLGGLQSEAEVERMYTTIVSALPNVLVIAETAQSRSEVAAMRRWRSALDRPRSEEPLPR